MSLCNQRNARQCSAELGRTRQRTREQSVRIQNRSNSRRAWRPLLPRTFYYSCHACTRPWVSRTQQQPASVITIGLRPRAPGLSYEPPACVPGACPRPPHRALATGKRTGRGRGLFAAVKRHGTGTARFSRLLALLIACIESGGPSSFGRRHCPVRLRLRRMLARAWAAAAQHWQCTCWLLHILAATAIICAIQEPLCGAWRRPTQVSQGHLSAAAAVHEPPVLRADSSVARSRNAALGRRSDSQQQPAAACTAPRDWDLENRASAGVWRSVAN